MSETIKTKVANEIRKAVAELDKPASKNPRAVKDCPGHEFITSDRCFYCGLPMDAV